MSFVNSQSSKPSTEKPVREWICLGCRTVFEAGPNHSHCCEEKGVVPFSPSQHTHLLIGMSNSWAKISGKWNNHPIYEEVRQKAFEDGVNGAASIHIRFVNKLIELMETSNV